MCSGCWFAGSNSSGSPTPHDQMQWKWQPSLATEQFSDLCGGSKRTNKQV
jgi:hypothetical protein